MNRYNTSWVLVVVGVCFFLIGIFRLVWYKKFGTLFRIFVCVVFDLLFIRWAFNSLTDYPHSPQGILLVVSMVVAGMILFAFCFIIFHKGQAAAKAANSYIRRKAEENGTNEEKYKKLLRPRRLIWMFICIGSWILCMSQVIPNEMINYGLIGIWFISFLLSLKGLDADLIG